MLNGIKPISKWEFKRELNDLGKSGLFLENAKKWLLQQSRMLNIFTGRKCIY